MESTIPLARSLQGFTKHIDRVTGEALGYKIETGHAFIQKQGFFWGGRDSIWKSIVSADAIEQARLLYVKQALQYFDTTHTSTFTFNNMDERSAVMCVELAYAAFGKADYAYAPSGLKQWSVYLEIDGSRINLGHGKKILWRAESAIDPSDFEVCLYLAAESSAALENAANVLSEYFKSVDYFRKTGTR